MCVFPSFLQHFSVFNNPLGDALGVDVKCGSWTNIKCFYTPADYIPNELLNLQKKKTLNCLSFTKHETTGITFRSEVQVISVKGNDFFDIDTPFQEGSFFFC